MWSDLDDNKPYDKRLARRLEAEAEAEGDDRPVLIGSDEFDPKCRDWAREGECDRNPGYMLAECAASCAKYR